MKTQSKLFAGCLLLLVCLSGGVARAGTEILFYPFARMFGSPPESELVRCRAAFSLMQTNFAKSRVTVMPVLFADADADSKNGQWRGDLAAAVVGEMSVKSTAKIGVSATEPKVAMPKPFKNQLRYTTKRSAAYDAWVKAAHPPGDYVFVAEIFGGGGIVYAIQIYVFRFIGTARLQPAAQLAPVRESSFPDGRCGGKTGCENLFKQPERRRENNIPTLRRWVTDTSKMKGAAL